MLLLIAIAGLDALSNVLSLSRVGLEGRNPAFTFGESVSLEDVFCAVRDEEEFNSAVFGDVTNIRLKSRKSAKFQIWYKLTNEGYM